MTFILSSFMRRSSASIYVSPVTGVIYVSSKGMEVDRGTEKKAGDVRLLCTYM